MFEPPFPDTEEVTDETYGPLKVACERQVQAVFGDRACVIRPGFIVGPHDPTDRFTSWVRRGAAGGEMLAPAPADYGLQWVDARDLAAFVLSLAEASTPGVFGVVDRAPTMTLGELIEAAAAAAGVETQVAWVDEAFIATAFTGDDDDPHETFPLWWPEAPGFHAYDPSRAFAAGLTCRPPVETVRDTLAWDREPRTGADGGGAEPRAGARAPRRLARDRSLMGSRGRRARQALGRRGRRHRGLGRRLRTVDRSAGRPDRGAGGTLAVGTARRRADGARAAAAAAGARRGAHARAAAGAARRDRRGRRASSPTREPSRRGSPRRGSR